MKRHKALTPLSREHHHLLILAQVLKQDVPPYPNMPATPDEQRAYALEKFDDLVSAHFRWEEEALLPLADLYGEKLRQLTEQVRGEHTAIRAAFDTLKTASELELPQQLDLLGRQLDAHVRFEERILFQKMQEILPDDAWISLEQPGRWN